MNALCRNRRNRQTRSALYDVVTPTTLTSQQRVHNTPAVFLQQRGEEIRSALQDAMGLSQR